MPRDSFRDTALLLATFAILLFVSGWCWDYAGGAVGRGGEVSGILDFIVGSLPVPEEAKMQLIVALYWICMIGALLIFIWLVVNAIRSLKCWVVARIRKEDKPKSESQKIIDELQGMRQDLQTFMPPALKNKNNQNGKEQ